ncbi:MAG TPA: lactonase family protein [Anaerohalosphaeraceae bacterium]|jgi:6-phosphogluconolactonase|nr:lactonase family protein [Anaerohalosphaeraceae bacterium]HRT51629.1 lactonase family protein [Anaerohalosphaeraceae bacterium]HRT87338.1 lactonase family protein [Anaerohalosphaeraceae bacterium]
MTIKTLAVTALSLAAMSASADSISVYLGTYTWDTAVSKGIYRSTLDLGTGRLSEPVLAAEAVNPAFLEIHPNGKFLYAVSESGKAGAVSAYAIEPDGGLRLLNQQPSQGAGPCHVNVNSKGTQVLVANYGSGSATLLPIKPDGSLAPPTCSIQHEGSGPNAARQKGPHAHSVNLSPDDRFAFVADLGIDKVMIYRLDIDRDALVPNNPPFAQLKPGAGPRHFTFHPGGRFAYVINELDCTITAFAYNPRSGVLTEIQTVGTLPPDWKGSNTCAEIRVHPNGRFLYGSNRGHDSVAVYTIDGAGKLTFVEHETADIKTPRNFNIEPSGKYCLVANQDANTVLVFRINPQTGDLEPTGNKVSVGRCVCIRFLKP